MEIILAIDGGGSRTRALAIDREARVVGVAESGPSNHLLKPRNIVRQSLIEAIEQTLSEGGVSRAAIVSLAAGLAGVDYDRAGANDIEGVFHEMGFEDPLIEGDVVIAHAGALALRPGVVVLAGTGSAILGVGEDGKRVKVGGWGPIFGDEGSAQRIGQMALRAAARDFDKRGPATELTNALMKALGIDDFRRTIARVYGTPMNAREIAALCPISYKIAEAGDEEARQIFLTAGEELAEGAAAAIAELGMQSSEVPVSYQGAVLESCALLRERFSEMLTELVPNVSIVAPRFPPVIGAYLLARRALGWELNGEVLTRLEARAKNEPTAQDRNSSENR